MDDKELKRLDELNNQTSWSHADIREMSLLHQLFYQAYNRVVYDYLRRK